ncbi:MAG: hypothetical protein ABIH89_01845 [Elusimicrobiota bacterium]
MDIKLILFDFGGVIAPEGFQLGILKLSMEFGRPFEEMYRIAGYKAALESGYTAGKTGEDEYWKIVAGALDLDKDLSSYNYVYLDNFQPRTEMIELFKKIHHTYKLGIFSDQTNWIYDIDNMYPFMDHFDYKFISYDLGFTKHDDEFYRIPAVSTGIDPARILVIDDKQRVIDNCIKAGMNGYLFTSIEGCREYISALK